MKLLSLLSTRRLITYVLFCSLLTGRMLMPFPQENPLHDAIAKGAIRPPIMPWEIKDRFSSVAGMHEQKYEVQEIVEFLHNPEKFSRLGATMPRGALLVGPPGVGKTLLARAVAGEAGVPFFNVSGSEFIEALVGVGAARIRELYKQAREHAPCIIFIDEIDTIGGGRGDFNTSEHTQTLNQLLTEMDGFQQSEKPIIVLAATNRVDMLDAALLRPGRFDRHIHFSMPDMKSRLEILQVHAKNVKLAKSVDLEKVAKGTPGFSGAQLKSLLNEAAIIATRSDKRAIDNFDLEAARDKIMMGLEKSNLIISKEELRETAYHEAGHAIIALMLPEVCDPLHKITIVPRGSALGVTCTLPEGDNVTQSEERMRASVAKCMGGRIAEEVFCNCISTGASNDFLQATNIVRSMVCFAGMSPKLGKVVYQRDKYGTSQYSEKTAQLIDEEVRRITNECYEMAKNIIIENSEKVEKLVVALLKKKTLFASEIYQLLEITPRQSHSFADTK